MPTLSLTNFNIVCATLGGFISVFGLVSYLLKEKFYLSEALISTIFGVIFSPHVANLIRPLDYALGNVEDLETITLYFTRLVLGVQLVLAGIQLPSKYLWTERRSLLTLVGPGMCMMWMVTSLIVWALIPHIDFVMAMSVGACVTPTDPILSNTIVKGKFADKNIPEPLQRIIIAESGANDGLGYPFLFIGLYLLKYAGNGGEGEHGGLRHVFALWFGETWGYTIILSVIYGAVVGWIAKELLHWAEERQFVDRESFLVFALTLALFIVGTVGLVGSDDVLACFIAGNVFTWDDWFRLETKDDSLQPTIDMLLNVVIFMWFGAICPWSSFVNNSVVPIYRLIPLGILVLLLRRLPMVFLFQKQIHQLEEWRHMAFMGWFGPIGVSAIFYLYVAREFLREIVVNNTEREDAAHLAEVLDIVVWFLCICSVVMHGLSVPLGKLGFHLPRVISTAISSERVSRAPSEAISDHPSSAPPRPRSLAPRRPPPTRDVDPDADVSAYEYMARAFARALRRDPRPTGLLPTDALASSGGTRHGRYGTTQDMHPAISEPTDGRPIGRPIVVDADRKGSQEWSVFQHRPAEGSGVATPSSGVWSRSIRFPDEMKRAEDV